MRVPRILLFLAYLIVPCRAVAQDRSTPLWQWSDSDWVHYHASQDRNFAFTTGMHEDQVRRLRLAAGVADEQAMAIIQTINARTLPHRHILVVSSSGNRSCLTAGVYEERGGNFEKVWWVSETRNGAGICQEPWCESPQISATKSGEVKIRMPSRGDDAGAATCDHTENIVYRPSGKTYALAEESRVQAQCGEDTFSVARGIAVYKPMDGERVANVERFPPFHDEALIAFEKTKDEVVVSLIAFSKKSWLQLSQESASQAKTLSQCVELAESLVRRRTALPVSNGIAQQLLDRLSKIDFSTQECNRSADGRCMYVMDGVQYSISTDSGKTAVIRDSRTLDLTSENPALWEWTKELLGESGLEMPASAVPRTNGANPLRYMNLGGAGGRHGE